MNSKGTLYTVLKKSEKYFKTDMVYMASGSFWLAIGQVVGIITVLASATAFANLLPPIVYGQYKFVLTIAGIILAFSLTGVGTAITQSVSRGFDGSLKEGHNAVLKWGVIMTVLAWSASLYYYVQGNMALSISMLVIGLAQPFISSSNTYAAYLQGKKLFKESVLLYSSKAVVLTGILIGTLFLTNDLVTLVIVYFFSQTLTTYSVYFFVIGRHKPDAQVTENIVSNSKHLSLMNIVSNVAFHIDKVLVFHFLGATQLAIYAFAMAIPEQIKGGSKALAQLALPKFAEKNNWMSIRESLIPKTLRLLGIFGLLTIAYIAIAPLLFDTLFPAYAESVIYSQVSALAFITGVSALPLSAMQAHMRHKLMYQLNITTAIVQILLVVVLTYYYGLWGTISARLGTLYFNAFLAYVLLYTSSGVKVKN